ncbi:protein phosphatase 2C domain-containing protein [Rubripirellula amarantea]|nr:protein phosphatase 2C domain-containing protein [Rubripirellula amarantea]
MSNEWNPGIVYAELTDVGMRRANNQDSMAALPAKSAERFRSRGHLFVVADGMGAHAAGELASRLATEHIAMQYFRSTEGNTADALRASVVDANAEIHRRGQSNPEFHNMGTTASALTIGPSGARIAHVGDSRVYRLRGDVLEQLTFDHSLVWEMEASGKSGVNVPKNVITRSLGPNSHVDVDVEGPFPIEKGDKFLICSDGLTGLVLDEELGPLLSCLSEEKAARVLVDLANLRGGPDNITLIVVHAAEPPTQSKPDSGKRNEPSSVSHRSHNAPLSLIATAILCLIAAVALGLGGMTGPMFIAGILAIIAGVFAAVQWSSRAHPSGELPLSSNSQAPYRRFDAKPNQDLYHRLGETVEKLREVSNEKNWMMEWDAVNRLQSEGAEKLAQSQLHDALRLQAEAIIETMHQLREQHNRAANETAIDT